MIRLGLTGGIGMGKSMAAKLLCEHGVKVIDSDEIARSLVEPGKPALEEIIEAFGIEFLKDDGELNREKLAGLVFSDDSMRATLEGILHPLIRKAWQFKLNEWSAEKEKIGVVVIPLLFETECEVYFDKTVCMACSEKSQYDRLRQRGWSDLEIGQRIRAQLSLNEKLVKSDHVIWTDGSIDIQAKQWSELLSYLFRGSESDG